MLKLVSNFEYHSFLCLISENSAKLMFTKNMLLLSLCFAYTGKSAGEVYTWYKLRLVVVHVLVV